MNPNLSLHFLFTIQKWNENSETFVWFCLLDVLREEKKSFTIYTQLSLELRCTGRIRETQKREFVFTAAASDLVRIHAGHTAGRRSNAEVQNHTHKYKHKIKTQRKTKVLRISMFKKNDRGSSVPSSSASTSSAQIQSSKWSSNESNQDPREWN